VRMGSREMLVGARLCAIVFVIGNKMTEGRKKGGPELAHSYTGGSVVAYSDRTRVPHKPFTARPGSSLCSARDGAIALSMLLPLPSLLLPLQRVVDDEALVPQLVELFAIIVAKPVDLTEVPPIATPTLVTTPRHIRGTGPYLSLMG